MYLYADSTFHCPKLCIADDNRKNEVLKVVDQYKLSIETVEKIRAAILEEMNNGLKKKPPKKSCLKMENTFIPYLPNGQEEGNYLSLDVGGTNFRIILSKLYGKNKSKNETIVKHYDIPINYKINKQSAEPLFDHIAGCLEDFLSPMPELQQRRLPLGFTFSFPMMQTAIDVGILIEWCKSYDIPQLVSKNVVEFLVAAIRRKKLNVEPVAIINDTTGTLIVGASEDQNCGVGVILGTGFNLCFIEKAERVEKWEDRHNYNEVVINIECGAFGDNGCIDFIKTEMDRELDKASLFPGSYTFEKMFSGKFLGDCVRRVMFKLAQSKLLFSGRVTRKLTSMDTLGSPLVSLVDSESNKNSASTRVLIESLGYINTEYKNDDFKIVEYICSVLSMRGALLASIVLATVIQRIDKEMVTVAIDGSLYKHPKYNRLLNDFISKLAPGKKFKLITAKDGSGKGAALVAAIAQNMKEMQTNSC